MENIKIEYNKNWKSIRKATYNKLLKNIEEYRNYEDNNNLILYNLHCYFYCINMNIGELH